MRGKISLLNLFNYFSISSKKISQQKSGSLTTIGEGEGGHFVVGTSQKNHFFTPPLRTYTVSQNSSFIIYRNFITYRESVKFPKAGIIPVVLPICFLNKSTLKWGWPHFRFVDASWRTYWVREDFCLEGWSWWKKWNKLLVFYECMNRRRSSYFAFVSDW